MIGITADIFSPGSRLNKLTIAVPLAVLPASGTSYPFNLYNFPLLLKNNIISCVDAVNICFTKSSSLVAIPVIPFPPLFGFYMYLQAFFLCIQSELMLLRFVLL